MNVSTHQYETFTHLIVDGIELPEKLANHPTLQVKYVSPKDISKMLLKQYTGWWNDIPSDWSPAPWGTRGAEIAGLAGGLTGWLPEPER